MEQNSLEVEMVKVILAAIQKLNSKEKDIESELYDYLLKMTKKEIFGEKDLSNIMTALEDKYEISGYDSLNLKTCAKNKPKACSKQLLLALKMFGVTYDAFDIQVYTRFRDYLNLKFDILYSKF